MRDYSFRDRMTVEVADAFARREVRFDIPAGLFEGLADAYRQADVIAQVQPVYGRSTGVGANRSTARTANPRDHGMNLIRSHAVSDGPVLPPGQVRAAVAVRLRQLLQGGSGIAPDVVRALAHALHDDDLAEIRSIGSVGTGDLYAFASIALGLIDQRLTGIDADSALPLMSSSALTIARAALIAQRLTGLSHAQQAVFALSALASRANHDAFAPRVAQTFGIAAAPTVAATLARLFESGAVPDAPRIQDPYGLRAFLPTHAVLIQSLGRLRDHVENLMNVAQENPLFDSDRMHVYHHGAFFQAALAHEVDATALALAQNAPLIMSRIRFLNDESFSGLPRFLAPTGGGSSGTMMVEYVAGAALGEVLAASSPASAYSAVLSCGVEEDATFAATAVSTLERSVTAFESMVCAELIVATRAITLAGSPTGLSSAGAEILQFATHLPAALTDRDMRGDFDEAHLLLPRIADVIDRIEAEERSSDRDTHAEPAEYRGIDSGVGQHE